MKRLFVVLMFGLALPLAPSETAQAHGNHGPSLPPAGRPSISEARAKERAKEEVDRLATANEIDPTWKEAGKLTAIERRTSGKRREWRATFNNEKLKEKNVLYVFLKSTGEFVAANYTGN